MCTVTIHRTNASVLVTMNRDEARFRAPEKPPHWMHDGNTPQWLAPIDGQAGGTWFGTNEYAVHACLLNRYLPEDAVKIAAMPDRPSRGRIIVELLEQGPESKALAWLDDIFHPECYPSFQLLVIGSEKTHSFAWDGHTLEREKHSDAWLMFSSSSWRTDEVLAYRKKGFDDWIDRGAAFDGLIPSFHLWQPPERAEWAPLMDRNISATRSITQTETDVLARQTEMRYWPREQLHAPATPLTRHVLPFAHDARLQ